VGASGAGAAGTAVAGAGVAGASAGTGVAGAAAGTGVAGAAAGTGVAGASAGTGVAGAGAGAAGTMAPPQTCPATSALTPGERTQQIQVGSLTRSFIIYVPQSYTGQEPVPLVLDWHGILLNSGLQRAFSGYAALAEQEGFIVAYPEGTDTAFNVGICCTSANVDDIGFARAIVGYLSQQGCIDQKRIHSVGYSMGGGMSMHLACNAADLFASVATSAFDLMPEEDWPCQPSRPIPLITFRSTGDFLVPYAGAVDTIPPNGTPTLVTFIGAVANFEKWASLDGCTGSPTATGAGCQIYTECAGGAEVELCTKQGGGHDYMPADVAWEFLKRHPMP
jgi:polyhydroxybutyrate depolymerase